MTLFSVCAFFYLSFCVNSNGRNALVLRWSCITPQLMAFEIDKIELLVFCREPTACEAFVSCGVSLIHEIWNGSFLGLKSLADRNV